MPHNVLSASIQGIDAFQVLVQIDSSPGIHALSIVGLADKAVQESQERVDAAVRNSGLIPPHSKNRRFTVNLSPADVKKEGASFDLPIAVAYLRETRQIPAQEAETLFAGELALDGTLSRTNGMLAMAVLARHMGIGSIVVPAENAGEAAFVGGVSVFGARTLTEVVGHLSGTAPILPTARPTNSSPRSGLDDSFAYIHGQFSAKRAIVVASAGNHNILMQGPPGAGKTLLARSMAGLLPPLSESETLEVAKIYSSVGLLIGSPAGMMRPFRSPHHTSSPASLVGGGTWPRPGEITLAHLGVLFLDELPEFARNVLEALRQPLEDGIVTVSRASGSLTMPAKFLLIAAMNPCPCGNNGDPLMVCVCSPQQAMRYAKKLSGPLLDRMDIQITVPRESVKNQDAPADFEGWEKSQVMIRNARSAQALRLSGTRFNANSAVSHREISRLCPMDFPAKRLLEAAVNTMNLSQRSCQKIRKVGMTIADIEGAETIREHHIAEAIALRVNRRPVSLS